MVKAFFNVVIHFILFSALTIVTQIGGFIYLFVLIIHKYFRLSRMTGILLFVTFYLLVCFVFVPLLSVRFGREPLPMAGPLRPLTIMTCLLNRHYVRSNLRNSSIDIAQKMNEEFPNTKICYLDASFPFWNGFPLFPHLSHSDGKKLDLAFLYFRNGDRTTSTPSPIGYGVYVNPQISEVNYPKRCKKHGFWQYDAISYLIPDWKANEYEVDAERTTFLIQLLTSRPETSKIFIEPHLKERWGLTDPKIRFHGCHAVRHDDHIHWQIE